MNEEYQRWVLINKQGQLMIQNNGNIERIDNIDSTMRRL